MIENLTVKDKILTFLSQKGISVTEFCDKTGIESSNFKGQNRKSLPGSTMLIKILTQYPELSADWLLTGEGEMLKSDKQNISSIDNSNVIGANVNGTGININSNQSDLIGIIRKQQEQIDKLIDTTAKMHDTTK